MWERSLQTVYRPCSKRLHRGRRAAAVASSAVWARTRKRLDVVRRSNLLVEPGGESYSSKVSSQPDMPSEQSHIFFALRWGCLHGEKTQNAFFCHKLDHNYWQVNKVICQTIRRLRDRKAHTACYIKEKNGVFLSNEDVLGRRVSISKTSWTQSLPHQWTRQEANGHDKIWRRKIPSIQPTFSCLSKHWRLWWNPTWNAQSFEHKSFFAYSCGKSGLVLWTGEAPKDWQTVVIFPYTRKETDGNAITTAASLSLVSMGKCTLSA